MNPKERVPAWFVVGIGAIATGLLLSALFGFVQLVKIFL